MFLFADDDNAEVLKGLEHTSLGRVNGKPTHLYGDRSFSHEDLDNVYALIERLGAERFDVESRGGFDVLEGFLVRVALRHHHALQAQRIRDEAVGMLFDDHGYVHA